MRKNSGAYFLRFEVNRAKYIFTQNRFMKLAFLPAELTFKYPFGISSGTRTGTPVVFTRIEQDGIYGYGEASLPPYLGESHASVIAFLQKAKQVLEELHDPMEIEEILARIDALSEKDTAAKASIDIALHDLAGKIRRMSWWSIWGLEKERTPYTTFTISIGDDALIEQKVKEAAVYKILKVKLGSPKDKDTITRIRMYTDKPLVVDVNQGWNDKHMVLDMIHWLKERNVLFVEQPMPKHMKEEMAWITTQSPLPTIGDESVQRLCDVADAKHIFSGINIKLMKCTGMHEAYKMVKEARKQDLKVFIGCMSETTCAVSAAAQLTPLADWADLDGPLLIREDRFDGIRFVDGKITLNDAPGIGITPKKDLHF